MNRWKNVSNRYRGSTNSIITNKNTNVKNITSNDYINYPPVDLTVINKDYILNNGATPTISGEMLNRTKFIVADPAITVTGAKWDTAENIRRALGGLTGSQPDGYTFNVTIANMNEHNDFAWAEFPTDISNGITETDASYEGISSLTLSTYKFIQTSDGYIVYPLIDTAEVAGGINPWRQGQNLNLNNDDIINIHDMSFVNGAIIYGISFNILDFSCNIEQGLQNTTTGNYSHAEGYDTSAIGNYSHTEGQTTKTYGIASHAEGYDCSAIGDYSHAEGCQTIVTGRDRAIWYILNGDGTLNIYINFTANANNSDIRSFQFTINGVSLSGGTQVGTLIADWSTYFVNGAGLVQGYYLGSSGTAITDVFNGLLIKDIAYTGTPTTITNIIFTDGIVYGNPLNPQLEFGGSIPSHAEGYKTTTLGNYSHAEGYYTTASGDYSHAEGSNTVPYGVASHAEGHYTTASGDYSHAEGYDTSAIGIASHAEGYITKAIGDYSHTEGSGNITYGIASHAEGLLTTASGDYSHAEGYDTSAIGIASHAEGHQTTASGDYSHAEGYDTSAAGIASHAEGHQTTASGDYSHAEGWENTTYGLASHAEGYDCSAVGDYSHAEGSGNITYGNASHAEGYQATVSGDYSHAEGYDTIATGIASHAEGHQTTASGDYAHTEGYNNIVYGAFSHIAGSDNQSYDPGSHTEGHRNINFNANSHAEGFHNTIPHVSKPNRHLYYKQYEDSSGDHTAFYMGWDFPMGHPYMPGTFAAAGATIQIELDTGLDSCYFLPTDGSDWTASPFLTDHGWGVGAYMVGYGELYGTQIITLTMWNGNDGNPHGKQLPPSKFQHLFTVHKKRYVQHSPHFDLPGVRVAYDGSYVEDEEHSTPYDKRWIWDGSYVDFSFNPIVNPPTAICGSTNLPSEPLFDFSHGEINGHAEGYFTEAHGEHSHVEGYNSRSYQFGTHAEGFKTMADGSFSHTQGIQTIAYDKYMCAGGQYSKKNLDSYDVSINFVIGTGTDVSGGVDISLSDGSRNDGFIITASGDASFNGNVQIDGCLNVIKPILANKKVIKYTNNYVLADSATPTISAELMYNNDIITSYLDTEVTGAIWPSALDISTVFGNKIGNSFDVTIANVNDTSFVWDTFSETGDLSYTFGPKLESIAKYNTATYKFVQINDSSYQIYPVINPVGIAPVLILNYLQMYLLLT